jgi:cyclohexanone monooxygenase
MMIALANRNREVEAAMSECSDSVKHRDVIVVGAGFGGLYALYHLRKRGLSVQVLEAGPGIGGTWFWNRYPGARCDIESYQYSYSFSEEIQREWKWSQHYAPQPEILRYINFIADRLDLRRDIELNARVAKATFDDFAHRWTVATEAGERFQARYCIMAMGCLSIPLDPSIPGLKNFKGELYRTTDWPKDGVALRGKRVGLVGTGSTGVQLTPPVSAEAAHLTVFQRTPNYSIPANNHAVTPDYEKKWKSNYGELRREARRTRNNTLNEAGNRAGASLSREEREREFEARWNASGSAGGIGFMYAFTDMLTDREVNAHASEFVKRKIGDIVRDPTTAEKLTPKGYGIGGKRICVDTDYFKTFNRDNVSLVDLRSEPIKEVSARGIRSERQEYALDVIILATGFDAITGALLRVDIRGRRAVRLRDLWTEGPKTYIGMMIAHMPNLFVITGPGSPSVFTNMVTSVEQHVEWIADCIAYMRAGNYVEIEASQEAQEKWVAEVNRVADRTIMPGSNSWYVGANVPGKPRVFMPYLGGAAHYNEVCGEVAKKGYEGCRLYREGDPGLRHEGSSEPVVARTMV